MGPKPIKYLLAEIDGCVYRMSFSGGVRKVVNGIAIICVHRLILYECRARTNLDAFYGLVLI